ncbi:MAG: rod shape-determining protein RodA [Bacteroidia bacterium]
MLSIRPENLRPSFGSLQSYTFDLLTFLLAPWHLVTLGWTIYAVADPSGGVNKPFSSPHVRSGLVVWVGVPALIGLIRACKASVSEAIHTRPMPGRVLLLLLVLLVGREINGAKSWLFIGSVQIQPAEFAKVATALALARLNSANNISLKNTRHTVLAFGMIALPAIIIVLQRDAGSALVFGSFLILFFREGLNPVIPGALLLIAIVLAITLGLSFWWALGIIVFLGGLSFFLTFNRRRWMSTLVLHVLVAGFLVGLSFSTSYVVPKLPKHQQNRIMVLFHPDEVDPSGRNEAYNFKQSVTAIGSGGFWGKGYRNGTYTKYEFVPEQETDFIFCTIGEERGWFGSLLTIGLLFAFLMRVRFVAEKGKTRFIRAFGYGALSIYFFHMLINIGMTIGLMPVIGIPLPFFSYGGSGLLGFSLLIAILMSLYGHRGGILGN